MTIEKELPYLAKLMSKQEWETFDFLRVLEELTKLALRRKVSVETAETQQSREVKHDYRDNSASFGRPIDIKVVPRSTRASMTIHVMELL